MTQTRKEKSIAKWLQGLFKFETTISFYVYDHGERTCLITIEAANEPYPFVHSSTDDYGRGPNSTIVAKFAREKLPKGERQWYSSFNGFMIPYDRLVDFKNKYCENIG